MRKQRSPHTLPSYETLSDWQISAMGSSVIENQSISCHVWPQLLTLDHPICDPYQDILQFNYGAAGDPFSQNSYLQNVESPENNYLSYDSWNPAEPFPVLGQLFDDTFQPTVTDNTHYFAEDSENSFQHQILRYGEPTVTDYGAVSLLLRHLIRVDVTPGGSISVFNFPAMSVSTLNAAGNKCYVKHPNGRVYQEGPTIHMVTGSDRLAKISPKGITFSSSSHVLAYFIDESGTKTTTAKFLDLSRDLTMEVFYDGISQNFQEECYTMLSETGYRSFPDDSELWDFGRIHIKQDKWGEVTVNQNGSRRTIITSPTIRRVSVESPTASISIDCYSKNYFTVRKDACLVTSGYCGLIAQKRSQKAGLDRCGRLVLF